MEKDEVLSAFYFQLGSNTSSAPPLPRIIIGQARIFPYATQPARGHYKLNIFFSH